MNIGIHILQQFPLSNPNRDLNGAPKCYMLGDHKRSSISSQCIARAIRNNPQYVNALDDEMQRAYRSRDFSRFIQKIAEEEGFADQAESLAAQFKMFFEGKSGKNNPKNKGASDDDSATAAGNTLGDKALKTLAFLGMNHVAIIVRGLAKGLDQEEIKKQVLDTPNIEIAGSGRMFADANVNCFDVRKAWMVGPATAVHATEFYDDDFIAADDLLENKGAAHLDGRTSSASLYYRHANLDTSLLLENLRGDKNSAKKFIEAVIRGTIYAQPSGHMGQFANYAIPDYVLVTFGENNLPIDLTKAYVNPVKPDAQLATDRLHEHYNSILAAYEIENQMLALAPMVSTPVTTADNVSQLVAKVLESF